ncbi:MAG: GIN domain-containing protein [Paludibacteraceae bacterium]
MKKTLTINLNNAVFHIDEDAYELLQSYLIEVGNHLMNEKEKFEIMADIEARIAELFNEKMDKQKNVVTIDDVDTVITIMGKPSQFVIEDDKEAEREQENKQSSSTENSSQKHRAKKYYRDIDNQLLSGVASGLGAYLNWDTTLIRIIFVVLAFVTSGTFVLIYLLMWLIVPKAETTAQKLEMHGEDVNIETIKNKMADAKEYLESDQFKSSATEVGHGLWNALRIFLKILVTLCIAIVGVVGVVLIAGLLFGLIVFLLEPEAVTSISPDFFSLFEYSSPDRIILLIISLLLIIGCPLFALIYWSTGVVSKTKKQRPATALWVSLVLWLAGIFMFVGAGAGSIKNLKDSDFITKNRYFDSESDKADYQTEIRTVPRFKSFEATGAVSVELTQQPTQSLEVRTLSEYLPNVKTEVVNGVLKIYSTDALIRPGIKVKIGIDSLENISASGASNIDFENAFHLKKLNIELQGASNLDLDVSSAQKLDITLQGASKLEASGAADTLIVVGEGASKVDMDDLRAKVLNIKMSGAGKAEVYASDEFNGKAYGASRITCKGSPSKRTSDSNTGSSIRYE